MCGRANFIDRVMLRRRRNVVVGGQQTRAALGRRGIASQKTAYSLKVVAQQIEATPSRGVLSVRIIGLKANAPNTVVGTSFGKDFVARSEKMLAQLGVLTKFCVRASEHNIFALVFPKRWVENTDTATKVLV